MGRNALTSHALALTLVAMLAWPWGVTLTTIEASLQGPSEGPRVLAKTASPARRVARALRWASAATPALWEDGSEDGEEGDSAEPPELSGGLFVASELSHPLTPSVRLPSAAGGQARRLVARLYRMRC